MAMVLSIVALLAYAGLVVVRRARPDTDASARAVLGLGVVAHFASLGVEWAAAGHLPMESMQWSLSALALLVAAGWVLSRWLPRMTALGPVLAILAALMLGVSLFAPNAAPTGAERTVLVPLHIGLVLVGFAGLLVAACIAALYLWVRRKLKAKQLDGIARLPNLAALDALGTRTTVVGFLTLTTGMAIGGVSLLASPSPFTPDLTIWATLALWAWYATALHLRLVMGWRGRLVALFGVGGVAGVGGLVVVGFALSGWHGFGA